jgi:hypothetical protein
LGNKEDYGKGDVSTNRHVIKGVFALRYPDAAAHVKGGTNPTRMDYFPASSLVEFAGA